MERFSEYLQPYSEPFGLAGILFAFATAALLIPRRLQLEVALACMVIALTIGRLPQLGWASILCKSLAGPVFACVIAAALARPGRRVAAPWNAWVFLAVAAGSVFYVCGAVDGTRAAALRLNWLLLVGAAVSTARTIATPDDLRRVLTALFVGSSISCCVPGAALLGGPAAAMHPTLGRFWPFGCNPNQISLLFVETMALGLYFAARTQNGVVAWVPIGSCALAFVQSVLTVSRASIVLTLLATLPSWFVIARRPMLLASTAALFGCAFLGSISVLERADFARFERGLRRGAHWNRALAEIQSRPWFGLLGAEGARAANTRRNAHNAYIHMLYLGGVTLATPLLAAQLYGHWASLRMWRRRHRLAVDPLLTSVLAMFLTAQLAHGFINEAIYYPTYSWAFWLVFLCCLFPSLEQTREEAATATIDASREREATPSGDAERESTIHAFDPAKRAA